MFTIIAIVSLVFQAQAAQAPAQVAQAEAQASAQAAQAAAQAAAQSAQAAKGSAWAPVFAAAITGTASVVAIVFAQFWTSWRDRVAKRDEGKKRREDQWVEFQMKSLVDLQQAMRETISAHDRKLWESNKVTSIQLNDTDDYISGINIAEPLYLASREATEAWTKAVTLAYRIYDEKLHNCVGDTIELASQVGNAPSLEEGRLLLDRAMNAFLETNHRICVLLVDLHSGRRTPTTAPVEELPLKLRFVVSTPPSGDPPKGADV